MTEELVKADAIRTARKIVDLNPVYLDVEATGLGEYAQIVDIALVDSDGTELINTLVRPTVPIPAAATEIHGIRNEDVTLAPTFGAILSNLNSYSDRLIVIYNRDYDLRLCRQSAKANGVKSWSPAETVCAMELYAEHHGDWNRHYASYTWQSQEKAARQLGIKIPADLHRAAADANLCRLIMEAMAAERLPEDNQIDLQKLEDLMEKYIETLNDEDHYYDGVCTSDQNMARQYLVAGLPFRPSFLEWLEHSKGF